jgi:L-glyceraldehyde 3-phosphate reductase
MFDRWIEGGLLESLEKNGLGCIVFSPLHQGLLTDKYLSGIPVDSRAAKETGWLRKEQVTADRVERVRRLSEIARSRGQSMAQMAIAWTLRLPEVTSALIGASRVAHIDDAVAAAADTEFSESELRRIEEIVGGGNGES